MNHNFRYDSISEALPDLAKRLLNDGDEVGSRNGRVMELDHVGITLDSPTLREVLVLERRVNLAAQVAETAWVLAGRSDVEWLSHYLPRAADFSDDGKVWRGGYGPRLRNWQGSLTHNGVGIDQLAHVVDLLRSDALTRRAVMAIYEPGVDSAPGKDIPCNNWITFSNRLGRLDMHVGIRSNDLMWGWSGINVFEWSVLQEVVAHLVGVEVGRVHFSTTSLHLYEHHWSRAKKIAQSASAGEAITHLISEPSPAFHLAPEARSVAGLDALLEEWFVLEQAIRTDGEGGKRLGSLDEDIEAFPEPMLRSWLWILRWWWTRDYGYLNPYMRTPLRAAASLAMKPPSRPGAPATMSHTFIESDTIRSGQVTLGGVTIHGGDQPSDFLQYCFDLHRTKHDSYGDSWKRRGEMLGILANIARKVDRLGQDDEHETSADTALDLMIYLAKYRDWLGESDSALDEVSRVNRMLLWAEQRFLSVAEPHVVPDRVAWLTDAFERLEATVTADSDRKPLVEEMLILAYAYARPLWESERASATEQWKAGNATRRWNPEAGDDA